MTATATPYTPATKAISYLRYSTKKQASGGSEKRQKEWAEEYCKANGLELIDTYKDLGISAHHGKHSKKGKLANLIKDCESGKIPKGYALIIENFDRLSREEVPIALQRFLTLINDYKLEIHTLDDKQVYRPDKLDMTELIISIIIMGRAHSESARKSVLVSKAWQQIRSGGKAFSKPGKRPLGNCPSWLDWDSEKQEWIVNQDAAATIKYIFKLIIEDKLGVYRTAQRLTDEKVFLVSRRSKIWSAAIVTTISKNRAVLGEWVPRRTNDKSAKTVKDYYPRIISDEVFEQCQMQKKSRNNFPTGRPVKDVTQHSILTGIAYYLGERLNKGSYKIKKTGETVTTYGILIDKRKRRQFGKAEQLEYFVCTIIAELDNKQLSAKSNQQHLETKLKVRLDAKLKEEESLIKKEKNWLKAIENADSDIPVLVKKLQQTQYDHHQVKVEIYDLERQISDLITNSGIHNRKEIALLRDKALQQKDLQSRQHMSVLLSELIDHLDLGHHPDDLPDCSDDFKMHAMTLHATTPIKYWARIKLFNDSIILGAMTKGGRIARIRWEE